MTQLRMRLALAVVLALCAVGAVLPSGASAVTSFYSCWLKPPGQWCDGRSNGSFDGLNSWDWNDVTTSPYSGSVVVCEHVWKPSTGGELGIPDCAFGYTGQYFGAVQCACYEAEVKHYAPTNRDVLGFADSDF